MKYMETKKCNKLKVASTLEKITFSSRHGFLKKLKNSNLEAKFNDSFVPVYCLKVFQNVALCYS